MSIFFINIADDDIFFTFYCFSNKNINRISISYVNITNICNFPSFRNTCQDACIKICCCIFQSYRRSSDCSAVCIYIVYCNVFSISFWSYNYCCCVILIDWHIANNCDYPTIWYIFKNACVKVCCILWKFNTCSKNRFSNFIYIIYNNIFRIFFRSYLNSQGIVCVK